MKMESTIFGAVCIIVVLGTVTCRDDVIRYDLPKSPFHSLQNLLMSSLSGDNDYNEQTDDSYLDNAYNRIPDQAYTYEKRGIGQCIFNCLKRPGQMNFIQCKSMCHR